MMLVVYGCFAVSQTAPIFRCRLGRLVKAGVAGNAEGVAGDVGGAWEVFLAMLRVMLVMLVVYGCFAVSQTAPIFRCRLGRLVKAGVAGNAEGVAGDVGGAWEVFLAMLRVMLVMLVVYGCLAVSQTAPIFRCRLGRLVKAGVAGDAEGDAGDVCRALWSIGGGLVLGRVGLQGKASSG